MLTLSLFSRLLVAWQEHAARARSERALGALPLDIQKDIGWPPHAHDAGRIDRNAMRRTAPRPVVPAAKCLTITRAPG